MLPRGFFLGLGLISLAVDRLAVNWRLPGAAAVLLLGLADLLLQPLLMRRLLPFKPETSPP